MLSGAIVPVEKDEFPVPVTQIETIPGKRTKTKGENAMKINRGKKLDGGPVPTLPVVPSGQVYVH